MAIEAEATDSLPLEFHFPDHSPVMLAGTCLLSMRRHMWLYRDKRAKLWDVSRCGISLFFKLIEFLYY